MPLEYACIMPHGGDIIPQLAARKTKHLFVKTRESMRKIARDIREVRPDTIVIASPHNLRLQGKIGIVTSENTAGQLNGPRGKKVNLSLKCDREFAQDLLQESARYDLPVVGANYGTAEGPASDMPMDWGTLVPMWFVAKEERVRAKTVIVTPSREIPLGQIIALGMAIGAKAKTLFCPRGISLDGVTITVFALTRSSLATNHMGTRVPQSIGISDAGPSAVP